ncbi:MAG TPA: hypothetical protein VKF80_00510 [Candidatus Eisenbacteria bacterium]|nr:hypothetical protein [Candidatus Eisenbacteria bacterium]
MSKYAIVCVLLCASFGVAAAGTPPPFLGASYPLPTSPASDEGALGATFNPAAWGFAQKPGADFWWNDRSVNSGKLDNWGIAVGQRAGFSARRNDFLGPSGPANVTDFQVGFGAAKGGSMGGIAYGWSGGDTKLLDRDNYLSFGTIQRPSPRLSLGFDFRRVLGTGDKDFLWSAALSPMGDDRLVVFGDYALTNKQVWNEGGLQGGIAIHPKPSFEGAFRMREGGEFQVSIGIASPHATVRAANDYQDGDRQRTDYLVRIKPK